jgi:nucleoside 2-deoxyribosyltransferase
MIVYLALPISGRSYDDVVKDIHDSKMILEDWGYTVFQPMTGKGYLRPEIEFKSHGFDNPVSTNHAILERDKWMVINCDVILLDLSRGSERVSIGGVMELAWASLLDKHTVVVLPKENNIHNHAFVLEASDVVFETMDEAMDYLHKLATGSE